MIQYHVPAEYADAVRAALFCELCSEGRINGREIVETDCPAELWWGVAALDDDDLLPTDVQAMFDPCPSIHPMGVGPCPDCHDGRRPVELVTDCPLCSLSCEALHDHYEAAAVEVGWETQDRSRKPWADVPEANRRTMMIAVSRTFHDCQDGTVTLGTVIAQGVRRMTLGIGTSPYYVGPTDASHAIRLDIPDRGRHPRRRGDDMTTTWRCPICGNKFSTVTKLSSLPPRCTGVRRRHRVVDMTPSQP